MSPADGTAGSVVTDVDALLTLHAASYPEALRVPALSLGLLAPPPGHADTPSPHAQDEVYVVVSGRGVLEVAGTRTDVAAGSVAYVPARVPHRFAEVREDLRVVVLFAPPLTDASGPDAE